MAAASGGFWGTVGKAAKEMDPNNKEGGEFKLPEQKSGPRKAPTPKKGGGIMSKIKDKIRGKRGIKR